MKILVFCNNKSAAQIVFELIRLRMFAGMVIPKKNTELIKEVKESGYVSEDQLFTPKQGDTDELIRIIKQINPDVCFALTFPTVFNSEILNMPKLGIYNFHFGRLPEYRSADPIFWQIRNREASGGLTVHKMVEKLDAGPIIFEEDFPIHPFDTYGSLLAKSAALACSKIEAIIKCIGNAELTLKPQSEQNSNYFSKPMLKDVLIDWIQMSMGEIIATVNAANPWNKGAITRFEGEEVRILQATPANIDNSLPNEPGLIYYADDKQGVFVVCKDQELLRIDSLFCSAGYISGSRLLQVGLTTGKKIST